MLASVRPSTLFASTHFSCLRPLSPRSHAPHATRHRFSRPSGPAHCRPKSTNVSTATLRLVHFFPRHCTTNAHHTSKRSAFSFLEWRTDTIARLKAKKAQLLVEYGSTFIFLHETLGIASYLGCFAIASLGFITIEDIINFIGVIPDNVKEMIAIKEGSITTNALTALVLLKCLDFLGLTPLRWAMAIALTPRIAWWVGPRVDASIAFFKSKFTKPPPVDEAAPSQSSHPPQ